MSLLIAQPNARAIETILFELSQRRAWDLRLLGNGVSSVAWQAEFGNEQLLAFLHSLPAMVERGLSVPLSPFLGIGVCT